MTIDINAPVFPESVADGTVVIWHKKLGDAVQRDEILVDIETDKVVLEISASQDGTLVEIIKGEGEVVLSGELIGRIEAGSMAEVKSAVLPPEVAEVAQDARLSPAARKLLTENNLPPGAVMGTGKGGLVTKEDVIGHLAQVTQAADSNLPADNLSPIATKIATGSISRPIEALNLVAGERPEKRVPMTRMRARIAERLLGASQNTAMLTTFNEVNMQQVMDLRRQYKDLFEQKHGTRLGFMGFFVKAATEALKRFPIVNASIDGTDVVYHGYQDIGIAVSTDKGLVVPVLRDTDYMTIADVEMGISDFGKRARDGKLSIEEMQGGTFTITNGGVYGSLMSTPILNPPQAAILGMHKIEDRAMVENGDIVIRPMMYLALSYDHRLVDGKDSVQFLVTVKDMLEAPARMLLDL